jgi:hypothetical protein
MKLSVKKDKFGYWIIETKSRGFGHRYIILTPAQMKELASLLKEAGF